MRHTQTQIANAKSILNCNEMSSLNRRMKMKDFFKREKLTEKKEGEEPNKMMF